MDHSALVVLMAAALLAGQPAPAVPPGQPAAVGEPEQPKVGKGSVAATEAANAEPRPTPPTTAEYLRPPILFCRSVQADPPRLEDIPLQQPSAAIPSAEREMLSRVAAFMRQHGCGIRIEGYTDNRGSAQSIARASRERAETVRDYLVQGLPDGERVKPEQVQVDGRGDLTSPPGLPREQRLIARIVL